MSFKYRTAVNQAAQSNADFYTTRLDPGQVRFLVFDQAARTWSFEKHILDGDALPEYVAVSYTWGPSEDTAYADDSAINDDGVPRCLSAIDHGQDFINSDGEAYSLTIDGKSFRVSRNVHELAMRATADTVEMSVWIDALCINQADIEERSSQVKMMGDIFAKAKYILTWLGTDDRNEAESVVNMLESLRAAYFRQTDGGKTSAHKISNPWGPGVLEEMGLPAGTDRRWRELARFCNRRWFNRVWIIQEIVANTDVQVWWGTTKIDFWLLMTVSSFILQSQFPLFAQQGVTGTQYRNPEWYEIRRKIGETLAKMHAFRHLVFPHPREVDGQPFLSDSYDRQCDAIGGSKYIDGELRQDCMRYWANMLETNRSFDATDPRDYIYATLGIINQAAENRSWSKTGVVVDYAKSVAEVYTDAAKRIMEASKCVNLISLAQDPQMRRQNDLPSWVPDFSARGEMPILLPWTRRWRLMPNVYNMAKELAGSSSPVCQVQEDMRRLTVKAIRLDKISATGESHHNLCNNGMWEKTGQILLYRESFAKGESTIESLWRTMVANTARDGESVAGPEMASLFKSFVLVSIVMKLFNNPDHLEKIPTWQKVTEMHRTACNHDEDIALLPSIETIRELAQYVDKVNKEVQAGTPQPKAGPNGLRANLFGGATECMFYRRVILNESGYLGFGPMSTQPGDEVWLLPGMPLPTILRKTESGANYKVLGESYFHGNPKLSTDESVEHSQWIDLV